MPPLLLRKKFLILQLLNLLTNPCCYFEKKGHCLLEARLMIQAQVKLKLKSKLKFEPDEDVVIHCLLSFITARWRMCANMTAHTFKYTSQCPATSSLLEQNRTKCNSFKLFTNLEILEKSLVNVRAG